MEMNDRTGQPRTIEELQHAIEVVMKFRVKGMLTIPPELYVELMTIHDALRELLKIREKFK